MYSFNEWAEHYGYTDSDESRREYQAYCDNLTTKEFSRRCETGSVQSVEILHAIFRDDPDFAGRGHGSGWVVLAEGDYLRQNDGRVKTWQQAADAFRFVAQRGCSVPVTVWPPSAGGITKLDFGGLEVSK